MIITQHHLNFWIERKAKYPRWSGVLGTPSEVSIHALINSQVVPRADDMLELANALHVLRLRRRRMPDRAAVTFSETALMSTSRRTIYARLLRKMVRASKGVS